MIEAEDWFEPALDEHDVRLEVTCVTYPQDGSGCVVLERAAHWYVVEHYAPSLNQRWGSQRIIAGPCPTKEAAQVAYILFAGVEDD